MGDGVTSSCRYSHIRSPAPMPMPSNLPSNPFPLPQEQMEADIYWCFTKMLDSIQDHYIFGQPGLQRMIYRLEDLTARLDPVLHAHLKGHDVMFMQFAFRWMNCLLIRELPFVCIRRLLDSYLSTEHLQFIDLHVYVCAVILTMFREELLARNDFHSLLVFLQQTVAGAPSESPLTGAAGANGASGASGTSTANWGESEMDSILAQAFILSSLFDNSPSHLNNTTNVGDA